MDTDTLTGRRSQEDGGRASDDVPTSQGVGEIARKFWNVGERPGGLSPPPLQEPALPIPPPGLLTPRMGDNRFLSFKPAALGILLEAHLQMRTGDRRASGLKRHTENRKAPQRQTQEAADRTEDRGQKGQNFRSPTEPNSGLEAEGLLLALAVQGRRWPGSGSACNPRPGYSCSSPGVLRPGKAEFTESDGEGRAGLPSRCPAAPPPLLRLQQ